jgi:hypothetical protein
MRRAEWLLAVLGALLSVLWALRVPGYGNGFPDEANHLAVARYIAENRALPPYSFEYYESAHPPLYHLGAAVVYAAGGPLAVRLATAVLGGWLVLLVFCGVRAVSTRGVALLAAALAATLPGRAFLFGGITNEALATLAGAGVFSALTRRRWLALTLWSAVGAGAKLTGLIWVLGAATLGARVGALALCGALLSLGPWGLRNALLHGDPLLIRSSEAIWSERIPGLDSWLERGGRAIGYLALVVRRGSESFVGVFDGFGRFLPWPAYLGTLALPLLALVRRPRLRRSRRRRLALAGLIAALGALGIFCAYNLRHFSPQGRFVYVALAPLLWWLAESWPARLRWLPPLWLCVWSAWALATA